ncbi:hypothetical protein BKA56DRAFT_592707 [Ilyonectria sp. MPI-CAGE-AT-0026]|nr:hypothetical protein BKA56DRAFT_592707 [Ilyonectria sp. MPI-CAGE-AT-0026]
MFFLSSGYLYLAATVCRIVLYAILISISCFLKSRFLTSYCLNTALYDRCCSCDSWV